MLYVLWSDEYVVRGLAGSEYAKLDGAIGRHSFHRGLRSHGEVPFVCDLDLTATLPLSVGGFAG